MSKFVINSDASLIRAQQELAREYREHRYVRVSTSQGRDRSIEQNSLSHEWYNEIAIQIGDTPESVKCECKLRYGVPIMRAEVPEFQEMYDRLFKNRYTYEEKLELMQQIPVTSLMTTKQLSRYLEHVQQSYAKQGVIVEFPEQREAA